MQNFAVVLRFGWTYLRRYKGRLAASVLCAILFALANASFVPAARTIIDRFGIKKHSSEEAAAPSPNDSWLDRVKARGVEWNKHLRVVADAWLPRFGEPITTRQIMGMLLFLPLLVLIRAGSDYLGNYYVGWVSERVIRDLRLDVMGKLSSLSLDFFSRWSTGDLLTRINSDTSNLLRALRTGAADIIKEPLTMAVILGVLVAIDWRLTLCTLVLLPAVMLPLFVLGRKARRATKAGLKASVSQSGQLVELLASIRVVKAFGLESAQLARFRKTSAQMVHAGMQGVKAKELVNPIIEVVTVFGLGALFVYVFWSGRNGKDLAGFLVALMLLYLPVKKMAGLHILFEQAGVGVVRLQEILAEQPSVVDPQHPKSMAPFSHEIRFEDLSFGYREATVLRNFNLVVPHGFRLGLAGESGSGKTTILNLLFRFYDPTSGVLKIDGMDVREVSLHDLREQMALVSQDTVLFDDTVAGNIAAGKSGASRAEIETAARAAFAHDFIMQLPQGYDTPIGERGGTLSGGQRQRLAIARAFVRNAPILVLDEATASLDSKAEAEVQAAIEALAEHRTVICVAHRLSTLASMDRIIVLSSEGRVVEQGSFAELLNAGGEFTEMARRQGIIPAPVAAVGC
ncbi:MAG: ATP-binding cassette, subfamily bacterial MsbA [Verrucomicrobiota bacterium]|jgi:subfamily B ATP-binding cassette protein MsbA